MVYSRSIGNNIESLSNQELNKRTKNKPVRVFLSDTLQLVDRAGSLMKIMTLAFTPARCRA